MNGNNTPFLNLLKKGTKKVKAHIRPDNISTFVKLKVKNILSKLKVIQPYFRKKRSNHRNKRIN